MTQILLSQLQPDPRNANVCSVETLEKIKTNIQRTNLCPPLIVRPHPKKEGQYILMDGHHRKQVLVDLGWETVECQIWDISEKEAQIALLTLNALRGTDNLRKRAELIETLTQVLPAEELAQLIPETSAQIRDMLALLDLNEAALREMVAAQQKSEIDSLPVPFTFMVSPQHVKTVEAALTRFSTDKEDRGQALVSMCRHVIDDG